MKVRLPVFALVLAALLSGCNSESSIDPDVLAARESYLLAEEPDGSIGILEARGNEESLDEIVLYGQIGSQDETWQEGKATFVITDPTAIHDAADDGHDHENCPFCKAKKEGKAPNPTAIVQVVDDTEKVLPIDARELFDVKEGDMVVVKGTAQVDAIGSLTLSAKGVYVRR